MVAVHGHWWYVHGQTPQLVPTLPHVVVRPDEAAKYLVVVYAAGPPLLKLIMNSGDKSYAAVA